MWKKKKNTCAQYVGKKTLFFFFSQDVKRKKKTRHVCTICEKKSTFAQCVKKKKHTQQKKNTHTHTHTHITTTKYIYTHTRTHPPTHAHIHIHTHIHTHAHTYTLYTVPQKIDQRWSRGWVEIFWWFVDQKKKCLSTRNKKRNYDQKHQKNTSSPPWPLLADWLMIVQKCVLFSYIVGPGGAIFHEKTQQQSSLFLLFIHLHYNFSKSRIAPTQPFGKNHIFS